MVVTGSSMEDQWKEEDIDKNNNNSNIPIPIPQVVQVLEALKQASHSIQDHHHHSDSDSDYSPAINALLELHTILSTDQNPNPNHLSSSALSHHLNHLKSLVDSLHHNSKGLKSFLTRRLSSHSINRVAASIESELQHWIDRETTHALSQSLNDAVVSNETELLPLLTRFIDRVSKGFNRELQQLVLKFKLFSSLESVLFDAKCSQRIREQAGSAVAALIRFNKDVFVGEVLMGPTVRALVSIASASSIDVLCSLIRSIRSPIVDEIESNGEISNIIALLSSRDLKLEVLAMECLLEIGYFGRKEAVEAMLKEGIVEKLMELQRSEEVGLERENNPFASSVARFAVQLEVGEGLRQRERRAFKPVCIGEILSPHLFFF